MRHLLAQTPEPAAVAPPPDPHPAYLDKSLSIALGIALCVAIAYLIIASLQNCLGRRRNQNQNQQLSPDDDHRHRNPAQDVDCLLQLEAIPVIVYDCSFSRSPGEICPICLAEYEEGEEVRAMPVCSHSFHKECIDRWLVTRSSFCPICRQRVIERAVEPARANCIGNNNNNNGEGGEGVRLDVVGMMISTQHLRVLL